MRWHRAILVTKSAGGISDVVRDEIPLGGEYRIDMARQDTATMVSGTKVRVAWVRSASGAEGYAPLELYDIDEGECQDTPPEQEETSC